ATAGYVVLAIDYRCWGASEGEPRNRIFPLEEAEDYRNAISYAETRPEIDPAKIGLWGTSYSGGLVLWVGAHDQRAKAVVSQVPVVDGRRWMQSLRTSEQWYHLMDRLAEDRRRRFAGKPSELIPFSGHGASDVFCAMPTDRYFMSNRAANRPGQPM